MPCSDITETIEIRLDVEDRLHSYSLNKQTCGAEVGSASLLNEWVKGLLPEEIIALSPHSLVEAIPDVDSALEFLSLKHLFALQTSLLVYIGQASGDPTSDCRIAKIVNDFAGVNFLGILPTRTLEHKIKACGNCRNC